MYNILIYIEIKIIAETFMCHFKTSIYFQFLTKNIHEQKKNHSSSESNNIYTFIPTSIFGLNNIVQILYVIVSIFIEFPTVQDTVTFIDGLCWKKIFNNITKI